MWQRESLLITIMVIDTIPSFDNYHGILTLNGSRITVGRYPPEKLTLFSARRSESVTLLMYIGDGTIFVGSFSTSSSYSLMVALWVVVVHDHHSRGNLGEITAVATGREEKRFGDTKVLLLFFTFAPGLVEKEKKTNIPHR